MFKYKFYSFSYNNKIQTIDEQSISYCLVIQLESVKILIGSFLNENNLIKCTSNIEDQITKENNSYPIFPFSPSEIQDIKDIFTDLDIVITTHFEQILALPYIISALKINIEKIKFLTTEPIIQLSRSYFSEFYTNFNSILLKQKINENDIILITDIEIDNILQKYQKLNFCEQLNAFTQSLDPSLMIELTSNGYELGSSNVTIHYFNKRICVLTKSSLFSYRYPKKFDYEHIRNVDVLIEFPGILNENINNKYEKVVATLMNDINNSAAKTDTQMKRFYSNILMIVDPFFIFEFVDIFRYKISKDIHHVYISKSVDSLMKYANINTGFINEKSIDKIYEFKLPFSFDEIDNFSHFSSFNSLIKSNLPIVKEIINSTCPITYFINKFSFNSNFAKDLVEFFIENLCETIDKVFIVNYPYEISPEKLSKTKKLNIKNYNVDYRLSKEDYNVIISQINPQTIYTLQRDMIDNVNSNNQYNKKHFEIGKWYLEKFNIEKEGIYYDKCYLLSQPKKCNDISYSFTKKNLKFYLSSKNKKELKDINQSIEVSEDNPIEMFENLLKKYLSMNNMEIIEFLYKEKSITISILNNSYKTKTTSEITILFEENEEPTIDIECDNYEDIYFLNTILSRVFE